jgi:hypothetical protein
MESSSVWSITPAKAIKKEENRLLGKNEVTGHKAASAASKVLRNPKSTKAEKSAAASALAQAPDHKKKNK